VKKKLSSKTFLSFCYNEVCEKLPTYVHMQLEPNGIIFGEKQKCFSWQCRIEKFVRSKSATKSDFAQIFRVDP
jgi:hypothetical protein